MKIMARHDLLVWRDVPGFQVRFPVDVCFLVAPAVHHLGNTQRQAGFTQGQQSFEDSRLSAQVSMYRDQRIGLSSNYRQESCTGNRVEPASPAPLDMCTPSPRWMPLQRMQRKTPRLVDAQRGSARASAHRDYQAQQRRDSGSVVQ